jgi:hypothetical protein
MPKANQNTIAQRIKIIVGLVSKGMPKPDIWQYMSDTTGISERTFERYWKEATNKFNYINESEIKQIVNVSIHQLQTLYFDAYKEKRYSEALQAKREIHKLLGLYPAEKHDVTSGGESLNSFADWVKSLCGKDK